MAQKPAPEDLVSAVEILTIVFEISDKTLEAFFLL
jgi:hypothetical protein